MLIPERDMNNIMAFIQKYFVPDEVGAELLTDEEVRVLYYESEGRSIGDGVLRKFLHFDIYVKRSVLNTVSKDALQRRDKLIARRIRDLLTGSRYVQNMRYRYEDDFDMGAKFQPYKRYHITFTFATTF